MKHTTPGALLQRPLLAFVRDESPTSDEFIKRFGEQEFHILRKFRIFVVEDGRLRLSRRHLRPDGEWFYWGVAQISLETEEVRLVRYGPRGRPFFSEVD